MVGRKLGIDKERTKEIDGDLSLHKELAPDTWGEFAVTAQKDSGEVVLERANHTLSWVCMAIVGIVEWILEVLGGDGCTHGVGDLVVKFVKDWIDSRSLQFGVSSIVPLSEVVCLPTLDCMDKDCVGIIIVEEKDVVHTTGGGEGKMSGLICGDHGAELVKFNCIGADKKMVTGNRRSWWG